MQCAKVQASVLLRLNFEATLHDMYMLVQCSGHLPWQMRSWREHLFQKLCQSMTSVTDTVSVNAAVSLLAQARRHTDKCYAKEMFNSISKQAGDILRTRNGCASNLLYTLALTCTSKAHVSTCTCSTCMYTRRCNDEAFHSYSIHLRNEVFKWPIPRQCSVHEIPRSRISPARYCRHI